MTRRATYNSVERGVFSLLTDRTENLWYANSNVAKNGTLKFNVNFFCIPFYFLRSVLCNTGFFRSRSFLFISAVFKWRMSSRMDILVTFGVRQSLQIYAFRQAGLQANNDLLKQIAVSLWLQTSENILEGWDGRKKCGHMSQLFLLPYYTFKKQKFKLFDM